MTFTHKLLCGCDVTVTGTYYPPERGARCNGIQEEPDVPEMFEPYEITDEHGNELVPDQLTVADQEAIDRAGISLARQPNLCEE